jgi:tRNA threonylcarbamoyladenosine biosynthesis protein TsaB
MEGMFTLVFETSTARGSLAIIGADGSLEQRQFTSDRSHNGALFPFLEELLDPVKGYEISRVLVGSGPGSYSGTRVGIAAAQGVAIARSCPAVAVPSILALPQPGLAGPSFVIGDARRGSFWTAKVMGPQMLAMPELTDACGLGAIVSAALEEGLSVFSFEEPERFPLPPGLRAHIQLEFPSAARLWEAWSAASDTTRETWLSEPPQPIYLKPPHITPAKRLQSVQP